LKKASFLKNALAYYNAAVVGVKSEIVRSAQDLLAHRPGLPDFSCYKIPKRGKIYHITTKYTKCPYNTLNGRKIEQMPIKFAKIFHCKTLQNVCTKIGILGLKLYHLATLA
jgi:hypothetical protein